MSGSSGDHHGNVSVRLRFLRAAVVVTCITLAWVLAFAIRFDGSVPPERTTQMLSALPFVLAAQLVALRLAGAHRHSWRYTSIPDLVPVGGAVLATAAVLVLVRSVAPSLPEGPVAGTLLVPYGAIGAYAVLSSLGLSVARVIRRVQSERRELRALTPGGGQNRRVLLIGAGRAGVMVANELQSRPDLGMQAVGFVDDDPAKLGRRIVGLDVIGTADDLETLVTEFDIDEVVIAIASASGPAMRRLVERAEAAGRFPLIVPGVYEIVGGHVSLNWFRPVAPEDLLGREPVELDLRALHDLLTGETVMVTGAGGSIGSELARQIARFGPAQLVLVERSEPALWAIHRELRELHPRLELVPAVADVTDRPRIEVLIAAHRPSTILHAAAHKHVPMMEHNPGEAIKNNVLGTRTVVDAAAAHDVERFVLISTDKAVNPSSVMGATKRLAERYVQHVANETGRDYVSVRFGNVLGSTGSVVPIFEQQIAAGGPVTVTHPGMRRYFMTIPEAAQLVLQAATLGRSGEVLVLDMGEPVRIVDLAEAMIRLSGLEPNVDIPIEFTGLRPGEKLFEELALTEEGAARTRHPKVWIGRTATPHWRDVANDLDTLQHLADQVDADWLRYLLTELVPEYRPSGDVAVEDPTQTSADRDST